MKLENKFLRGRMNKDVDERLVPPGEYRDAQNSIIRDTENSDSGSIQNALGNEVKTNVGVGANPVTLGWIADRFNNTIVWFVTSDSGDEIFLYDDDRKAVLSILKDTRTDATEVLRFSPDHPVDCRIIVDSDNDRRFLIWTDGLNEPRMVNIDQGIGWAANGFNSEDITLLKKAPIQAPNLTLENTISDNENVLKERMLQFAYQYRYQDQLYSALSPFSEVAFEPSAFDYDYATTTNESMVNKFNQVRVNFNTGSDKVEAIRIVFKEPGSSSIFLVEEIDKSKEELGDNVTGSLTFKNDKYYTSTALRTEEIDRLYDNVPTRAERLEIIGNRIIFGNYTEGYDMVDPNGKEIKVDFEAFINSEIITDDNPVKSLKSNRSYEVGISYLDSLGRTSPVFTSKNNTAFVPNNKANYQNKLAVKINSLAPDWATHYRLFIKEGREPYDVIAPLIFYQDGRYIWLRLEGNDIDKVSKGDFLYVKASTEGLLSDIAQVEVLEVQTQERNFLEASDVTTIEQQEGVYMKIRPEGFTLNEGDVSVFNTVTKGFRSRNIANKIDPNSDYIEDPVYYGQDGLNDIEVTGTYTGTTDIRYLVEINAESTPDTFRWSDNNGASWTTANVSTSPTAIGSDGVSVQFGATTGHNLNDSWVISAKSADVITAANINRRAYIPIQGKTREDEGIQENAVITISYKEVRADFTIEHFEQSFRSTDNYANIEEWFYKDQIYDELPLNLEPISSAGTIPDVFFRRGTPQKSPTETIDVDPAGDMFMILQSQSEYFLGDQITVNVTTEILEISTNIIFETIPGYTDTGLFYEWAAVGETFEISTDGYHKFQGGSYPYGQDQNGGQPALVESNAFNCFAWNNGFESYKIKDKLTGRPLNLQTRALFTYPNFRENKRIASLTYSGPYEQTTNLNRLNEFNLSTQNFKDLDDKYGRISGLLSRDTDLFIWQEDKVHRVLFQKSVLFNADGSGNVSQNQNVLGQEVAFSGEYGLQLKDFRAIAFFGNRIWWPDARRGVVCRLGGDGITEISQYGMRSWFRDQFREGPNGDKVAAYDPYYDQYMLGLKEDTTVPVNIYGCGTNLSQYQTSDPFVFTFPAEEFTETWEINYNITEGAATISAVYEGGGSAGTTGQVTGSGTFNIPRNDTNIDSVTVTITPNTTPCTYEVTNNCVTGDTVRIVGIAVFDSQSKDVGTKQITWEAASSGVKKTIRTAGTSTTEGVETFKIFQGLKSVSDFPDTTNTIDLEEADVGSGGLEQGQGWSYLVSTQDYNTSDLDTILASATPLTVNNVLDISVYYNRASFTYTEAAASGDTIYLVFDYRSVGNQVVATNDNLTVFTSTKTNINVLSNDSYEGTPVLTILSGPDNGSAAVLITGEIRYINDGTPGPDSITYQLGTEEGDSTDTATITINVDVDITGGDGGSGATGLSFLMSGTGFEGASPSDGSGACSFDTNTTRYHNGLETLPTLDDFIYTDEPKTTPFNGQDRYYAIPNGRTIKVNSTGRVVDVWICTGGGGGNA